LEKENVQIKYCVRTPGFGSVRRWIDHCHLAANLIFHFTENKNIALHFEE
jgi:hypothetical protein